MQQPLFASIVALAVAAGLAFAETPDRPEATTLPPAAPEPEKAPRRPAPVLGAPITDDAPPPASGPLLPGTSEPACESYLWVSAEYLLWWVKNGPNPVPLATTGDPNLAAGAGGIGQPGTAVLLGGQDANFHAFSGLRLALGCWIDPEDMGLEVSAFGLPSHRSRQTVASDANGSPALFIPVNDAFRFGEEAFFVAAPGLVSGSITVESKSQLWGIGADVLKEIARADGWHVTADVGFRHLNLDERIDVLSQSLDFTGSLSSPVSPGNPEAPGSTLTVSDAFHARNYFFGGRLGARAEYVTPFGLYAEVRASVALGLNHAEIDNTGSTAQVQPGRAPAFFQRGILVTVNNNGHFEDHRFSVAPEGEARVGYQFGRCLRVFAGYDYLNWSDVIRPGNQISHTVDERQLPRSGFFNARFKPTFPTAPIFSRSDFWAQGATVGAEFRY